MLLQQILEQSRVPFKNKQDGIVVVGDEDGTLIGVTGVLSYDQLDTAQGKLADNNENVDTLFSNEPHVGDAVENTPFEYSGLVDRVMSLRQYLKSLELSANQMYSYQMD